MSAKIIPFPVIPRPIPRAAPDAGDLLAEPLADDELAQIERETEEASRRADAAFARARALLQRMQRQIADLTAPPAPGPNGGRSDAD